MRAKPLCRGDRARIRDHPARNEPSSLTSSQAADTWRMSRTYRHQVAACSLVSLSGMSAVERRCVTNAMACVSARIARPRTSSSNTPGKWDARRQPGRSFRRTCDRCPAEGSRQPRFFVRSSSPNKRPEADSEGTKRRASPSRHDSRSDPQVSPNFLVYWWHQTISTPYERGDPLRTLPELVL
jgi:hypothetical protein